MQVMNTDVRCFSRCAPILIHLLKKRLIQDYFFLQDNVQILRNLIFDLKKPNFTWLVAAILVLIMTETDIECGHTKTALYAHSLNKDCKMITFTHLNSSDFNDNFKDNFMQEEIK